VLVALGLVVLVFWSRLDGAELTAALILAFLVVTAGFGSQYLLWPAALLMITGGWRAWVYLTLAAGYAVFSTWSSSPGQRAAVSSTIPMVAAIVGTGTRNRGSGMLVPSSRAGRASVVIRPLPDAVGR
jgi:hypothetical protein